ncbi:hypothetical protein MTR_6g034765 [Medicago truncatula]|uniref:Uncharacterized protein n=1 Tax=Medicago truncatula TaxID=3880 RepID=A0A072UJ43_MEDTR|nr:hypothetical protein MTR_6g034765 [Medicago truncatula]
MRSFNLIICIIYHEIFLTQEDLPMCNLLKLIICDKHIRHRDRYLTLNSLSLVSKQFLFIRDRLRFSLTICTPTVPFLDHHLFKRFTNLSYLYLSSFRGDVDALISQIFSFQLNITRLILCDKPANLFLIANCFPNLQQLNLSHFKDML